MFGLYAAALVGVGISSTGDWQLDCSDPFRLLLNDLNVRQEFKLPVPGSPIGMSRSKRPWVSLSLLPDLVGYETESFDIGRSPRFSVSNDSRSFKAQLLRRLGLQEVRSKGFGATLRFAGAPNWAFQFRGRKRFTVAYITRF